ncbi:MAG: hypothetical protein JSV84_16130 [Gemmatimonadota bacterium]|nr:MAG: hypothetical protein JSV84_16130 [Gemmatimonadota bacterium]
MPWTLYRRELQKLRRSEKGSVLLLVLFWGLMISVLGVTAYYVANTEITQSSKKYEMAKALYLAEGGLERAIVELKLGIRNGWDDEIAGADGDLGTEDDGILSFGDQVNCYSHGYGDDYDQGGVDYWNRFLGHYDVRIVDGRRPGESPEKCNRVIVGSDGVSTKNFERRVEAEVELWELKLPEALVYIDGGTVDAKFDGNAFLLDGKDTSPDGSPGAGPNVPAILVSSWQDANTIKEGVFDYQCDKILGVGNLYGHDPCDPSVADLGGWNPNDFNPNRFRTKDLPKLEEMVNHRIPGGTYAGQYTIGAPDEYLITKATGSLHITGPLTGYGVLIVDGDFIVTGMARWDGLIIVKNEARMSGGGCQFHLYGTLIILNESGLDNAQEFQFSGQSDGFFCRENIVRIQDSVQTLVVNTWRQSSGL